MAVVHVEWNEDSDATILARVTARDGSGAATGEQGEGNWLQQADISSITCKVFDLGSSTTNPVTEPTVTIANAIQDTPVTANTIWTKDTTGYNFIHDLAAAAFPTGGNTVRVEYKFTLTSGMVFYVLFEGDVTAIYSS